MLETQGPGIGYPEDGHEEPRPEPIEVWDRSQGR